jgi:hypothetical protein
VRFNCEKQNIIELHFKNQSKPAVILNITIGFLVEVGDSGVYSMLHSDKSYNISDNLNYTLSETEEYIQLEAHEPTHTKAVNGTRRETLVLAGF